MRMFEVTTLKKHVQNIPLCCLFQEPYRQHINAK